MNESADFQAAIVSGEKFIAQGKYAEAKTAFESALKVVPKSYQGWLSLSFCQFHLEQYSGAIDSVETAERFDPLSQEFLNIQRFMQSRKFSEAFRQALAMNSKCIGHPRAVFTLAHLHQMRNAHEDGADILIEGLARSPANTMLRKMLIGAYEESGEIELAIQEAKTLIKIQASFEHRWRLIELFIRYGFNEDALQTADSVRAECDVSDAMMSELNLLRGHALRTLGRRQEAIDAYRAAISVHKRSGASWWALADMKTYKFSATDIQSLEALSRDGAIPHDPKTQILFALAKARENQSGIVDAMPAYHRANASYSSSAFNSEAFTKASHDVIEAFGSSALSKRALVIQNQPIPIFIVGLPRSGSTLIEQILASHSQIEGTMELPILPTIKRKIHLDCVRQFERSYLQAIGKVSEIDLKTYGEAYLAKSAIFRREKAPYFIDKLPHNFEHIGLIHKILPQAIIIDARRNPLECGLSLYKQYFARGVSFSYRLEDIRTYYQGYRRIMRHWHDGLPGYVYEVQYEDLVLNIEGVVRSLLNHIGLAFEKSCLKFHENKRSVRTASSEQVRQPLYASSLNLSQQVEGDLAILQTLTE